MYKINVYIDRYEIILGLIILLLTGSISMSPGDKGYASYPSERYPYTIALTFDDGPHPKFTPKLVSLLKAFNAPATFFIVGRQALEYPYLVEYISNCGNELAGHTFSHRNMSNLSDPEIQKELQLTKRIIRDISGQKCNYFRPPGGRYGKKVEKISQSLGIGMVLWTVFPKDHTETNPEAIIQKVLGQAGDRGVILLHSGIAATYEALPRIIEELRSRGYRFVTISELAGSKPDRQLVWLK